MLDAAETFWREKLKGITSATSLGVMRGLDVDCGSMGLAEQPFHLTKTATASLESICRQHDFPLSLMVQAAWALLLSHYSGERDVVFGSNEVCSRESEKSSIGLSLNILPLRIKVPEKPLLLWLKELQAERTETSAYEQRPLAQIHEWSDIPLESPLFETLLVFEACELNSASGAQSGGRMHGEFQLSGQPGCPLTLVVNACEQLSLKFVYESARFNDTTIDRLAGHFTTLLQGFANGLQENPATLPILTTAELKQIEEWNQTESNYPSDNCLHQLFEEQALRTPDSIALIFDAQQLTYRELNERANQLAHYLQETGIKVESRVGICMERSVEMVVAMLGTLKAGGAYVPLDPQYPGERLSFMLHDAGVSVVLTQQRLLGLRLPEHQAQFICVDADWERIAQHDMDTPLTNVASNNLAYVIYTSGSTGQPKGVMNSHGALCNHLSWRQSALPLTQSDRFLQKASFSFDISVWEIFGTLLAGARLILARPGGQQDSGYLVKLIAEQQVTVAHFGPSMLQAFLQEPELERCGSLRQVFCGGEPMSSELKERFFSRLNAELCSQYGPTEASVDVTFYVCPRQSNRPVVPIGRPIANTRIYLLDSNLKPVPVGVPGELHISGMSLARGYLNRPDLTAERFIPNPFSLEPGERLYKTGDRARYLADGNIEFLGRLDKQIKLRGFRIELGEIEAALAEHPSVLECVVLVRTDARDDNRLTAYIVADKEMGGSDFQSYLKEKLPEYMVPSAFVMLDKLPLTANGKIDRRALPAPDEQQPETDEALIAPRTPIEEVLAGIWCSLLGLEQVCIQDNFFDLGGHSLKATQVMSRVRAILQVDLPLQALFEAPTVAGLAEKIETARRTEQGLQSLPLVAVERSEKLPLSFSQQRLWFLSQLEPDNLAYHVPQAIRLTGTLNVEALQRAINSIVTRHEVLRTTFSVSDGEPVQVIQPEPHLQLSLIDLSSAGEEEREEQARQIANKEAAKPFNLEQGPLLRCSLLRLREEEHVLLIVMHHIVTDGWSTSVLLRELRTLYEAYIAGEESPLEELEIQYADFAHWQREWLTGEVLERELGYWREQLQGAPPVLELPTDYPRPAVQSHRGAHRRRMLSRELTAAIKRLSQGEGVTLFMTLLAAFQTLLYRYSHQRDFCVGADIANRNRAEVEPLIGFFVNMLVLRADISGNPTFRELLKRVREVCLGAYAHQDVPFEKLVEELEPERALSHTPLFQVVMLLQNLPRQSWQLSDLTVSPFKMESETAKFDLILAMMESDDGLAAVMEYSTDLFEAETIERMLGHLEILLTEVVRDADQRVTEVALLTAEEQQQIEEWNQTESEYPSDTCVHQLFEEHAEKMPDAVALVFEGEQISYAELNERANQLAHYLLEQGAGPDRLVGVCMQRSIEMVVALLGILKAGAAYVPLDPEYPRERLSFMIQDADVPVLLTQEYLLSQLPEQQARVICLDTEWHQIARHSTKNPARSVTTANLAYVIYTSGSTGQPKGAMNTHSAICNRLLWMQETYNLSRTDHILQKTPFSFDVSVWEFFWPLMVGARLVLARPEGHRDASYLIKLIRSERITTLHFVPSMLRLFLDEPGVEACRNLRRVICSGEALELSLQEKFFKRLPNVELHNLYGPTEAAVDVTYWRCEPESVRRTVPIGRPISNVQIYLLDEHLQVVPVGVTGELHIGGVGLGRGYWKRPGLTAEKFIPHPHSPVPGERLYKTGDVAQYLPDGNINYLGRADYQVKIRGMRIELGEIETVLAEHSAVEEALVLIREYGPSDNRLVAYLIPDQQHACAVRQLLRLEMQGLPDGQEITELPNGMRIVHRNKGETDFLYSEIFESQAYLKHGITLDEDSCIFDVGANIGLFTLFMGRLCERATIYAFEPIPPVFRMLQANAAIHGMNVKLYECGLSGHSASERFTYYPHCSILSGRFADVKAEAEIIKSFMLNDEQFKRDETLAASADMLDELVEERLTSEEYTCRLRTISEVIEENGIERIDLLKIDVEKSEEDVLAGIKETDWNKIRQIIVEVHDVGGRLNQLTSLLKKHGYVLTVEQDPLLKDTDLYNIYALRPVALANDSDKRETTLQTGTPQKWNSQDDLVGDVQRYLQEKLPDYMIPSQFVLLDELPLTPNGKVDRRALPAPDQTHLQPGSSYVAPSTPEEEILAGIFQQVLKVEQVGVHDNFFTLGGHSLLATQVISRIRHSFQIELPLTALFKSPTVAALSTLIEELIIAEITAEAETELAQ